MHSSAAFFVSRRFVLLTHVTKRKDAGAQGRREANGRSKTDNVDFASLRLCVQFLRSFDRFEAPEFLWIRLRFDGFQKIFISCAE